MSDGSASEARRRAVLLRRRLRRPPGHWKLLAVCLAVLAALIAFQGFATHTIGASSETRPGSGRAAPLAGSRPLLAADGHRLRSPQPPPGRRIALTFDDGPDPRWTPEVLAVLRREDVPATFFMVGSQAARHPDLVRAVASAGSEIAAHTFTHSSMTSGARWQRQAQVHLTEAILLGITGHYPRFIRPPYSATADAVTPADERALADAAGSRYVIALADYDSRDWARPGVARIVTNATPPAGRGGIVMFHDGGGNRSADRGRPLGAHPPAQAAGLQLRSRAGAARPQPGRGRAGGAARGAPARDGVPVGGAPGLLAHGRVGLAHRRRRAPRRPARPAGRAARRPAGTAQPTGATGGAPSPRRGHRARLQRGGRHRACRAIAPGGGLPGPARHRRRRRLHRRHGRDRGGDAGGAGAGHPPRQRRQGRGPDDGRPAHGRRGGRHGGRRHRLRGGHHRPPRPAPGRPAGRRRGGQHEGRQPPRPARALAAHRVRHGLQPRPAHVRDAAVHADGPGCDRRVPPQHVRRGRRRVEPDPRRGHRPHPRHRAPGSPGRLRRGRASLDRGALDAQRALASALPLVVRHDAGGLEAQGRRRRATPRRPPDRPARPAVHGLLPDPAAAHRAAHRPLRALRHRLHRPSSGAAASGLPSTSSSSSSPRSPSGSTASRSARCGRSRCSSSSTAS